MTIIYETGERVMVRLTGVAEDVPIRLETEKVKLDDTYLSLASSRTIRLYNDSNIVTKFQWKTFASDEEDERYRLQKITELDREEAHEEKKLYESFVNIIKMHKLSIIACFRDSLTLEWG
jgi:hypothetical protein